MDPFTNVDTNPFHCYQLLPTPPWLSEATVMEMVLLKSATSAWADQPFRACKHYTKILRAGVTIVKCILQLKR